MHSAYQTPLENFLSVAMSVTVDTNTKELFKNYKMNFGFYDDTLVCFIQCSPSNPPAVEPKVPSVKIDGDIKMRFLIRSTADFFNKTFTVPAGNRSIYQFSNKINNVSGGVNFLTAPVEPHQVAKDYDGDTIVEDGGFLYTSKKAVKAADNIPITDTNFWKILQATEQVVNNADLLDAASAGTDENCFAVLDMYNSGTTNNSYKLFDSGAKLFNPPPSFTIKFESSN